MSPSPPFAPQAARLTRRIILFIGPLMHQFADFRLPQAGGCKLGSRTVRPHFYAVEPLGVHVEAEEHHFHVTHSTLVGNKEIVLYESGDTVTENAIMAAALIPGATTFKYVSSNYQVAELCYFLEACGVKIDGVGLTTITRIITTSAEGHERESGEPKHQRNFHGAIATLDVISSSADRFREFSLHEEDARLHAETWKVLPA